MTIVLYSSAHQFVDLRNTNPAAPEFHDFSTAIITLVIATLAIVTVEMAISWRNSSSHLSAASVEL
jgi:hypothetical protein